MSLYSMLWEYLLTGVYYFEYSGGQLIEAILHL